MKLTQTQDLQMLPFFSINNTTKNNYTNYEHLNILISYTLRPRLLGMLVCGKGGGAKKQYKQVYTKPSLCDDRQARWKQFGIGVGGGRVQTFQGAHLPGAVT